MPRLKTKNFPISVAHTRALIRALERGVTREADLRLRLELTRVDKAELRAEVRELGQEIALGAAYRSDLVADAATSKALVGATQKIVMLEETLASTVRERDEALAMIEGLTVDRAKALEALEAGPARSAYFPPLEDEVASGTRLTRSGLVKLPDGVRESLDVKPGEPVYFLKSGRAWELLREKDFFERTNPREVTEEMTSSLAAVQPAAVQPEHVQPKCRHGHPTKPVECPNRPGWIQDAPQGCGLCRPEDSGLPYLRVVPAHASAT